MKEDWINCKLGDLLKLKNGFAFKSSKYTKEGIPVLRIGDIYDWNVNTTEAQRVKEETEYDSYIVNKGDILIAMSGATTGKFGIYKSEEKAYQNQRVGNLIPYSKKFLDKNFVFYLLYSLKREIEKEAYGGAQPNISAIKIEALNTTLAPLPFQRAIVLKIENLFASLDKGITDLKTAQEQLKVYRQAVLKKAFEGGFANKKIKEGALPNGWQWEKSGNLFSFVTSGSRDWAKYYAEEGSLFIRVTNLNFDTLELDLRPSKNQYVKLPNDKTEGLRTKVQEGDFLFSITGYLGMFAIAPKLENAYVNQHVSLCRPKEGFDKKYFGYWIISKSGGLKHFNSKTKGAVKAGLDLDDLKTIPIPLPPSLEEQQQIVKEIESRLSVCDKVEESITEALEKSEALRQSILKKAFEGKLLSKTEIEKCKQEADYEPASILLEKIKAIKNK